MKNKFLWQIVFTVFAIPVVPVAKGAVPSLLSIIQQQLSGAAGMAYVYNIEQQLPDGSVNKLKGRMEKKGSYYCESNEEELIIQDAQWWYKLDHVRKTVFIINAVSAKKRLNGKKDIFAGPVSLIPDSIIAKYGKINLTTSSNIAKVHITFSKEVMVQDLYLEYDTEKHLPLIYRVRMVMPYAIDGRSFEESYLTQTFTATDFSLQGPKKELKLTDYFSFDRGKIRLRKYQDYQLIQQL